MAHAADDFELDGFPTHPGKGRARASAQGCPRARRLFASFLDGEISAARLADALGAHFGDCPACRPLAQRPSGG